jgi:ATP-dependent RNA helicase DOB1
VQVRSDLEIPFAALRAAARRVGKAGAEAGLSLDVAEYVDSFRPELADALAAWAGGARFSEALKASGVFEGSLTRAIRRQVCVCWIFLTQDTKMHLVAGGAGQRHRFG